MNSIKKYTKWFYLFLLVLGFENGATAQQFLSKDKLKRYVDYFNSIDTETVKNYVTNDKAYDWLASNIPLFECPDTAIEKIYYYRWWAIRKHLKETPEGFVFTEFITQVNHAGKYNKISLHELIEYTVDDGRKSVIVFTPTNNSTTVTETFEPEPQTPAEMQKEFCQAILNNFKKYVENN